jgi:restriction endonuclease Mrr
LIQAKRWSNRVGVEPVRQLLFLHSHHRVTKSCLATTSVFTEGAWALATQYRWQLELRDLDGIRDWVATAVRLKRVAQSG